MFVSKFTPEILFGVVFFINLNYFWSQSINLQSLFKNKPPKFP